MQIDNCAALVTGASAGIGREFARQLGSRAKTIVLVARRQDRLEQLRAELSARNPALTVHVHAIDLQDTNQISALSQWLAQQGITVDLLINNAGLGDIGFVASGSPEKSEQMLMVNVVALTKLTQLLLPGMLERNRGGVLNVSSSAGFLAMPGFAVYAATKAYVNSFTEALRQELDGTGISVCALCPGPVRTEFNDVAKRPGQTESPAAPEFVYVSAEGVAAEGLAGIENNRAVVIPGGAMKIAMFVTRLIPMPVHRQFARIALRRRGLTGSAR